MKKQYYKLLFLTVLTIMAVSCKRTLEPEPLELLSEDYIWDTQDSAGTNAGQVLNDVYSAIPNGFNRILSFGNGDNGNDFLDAATDDAVSSGVAVTPVQLIATGGGFSPFANLEGGNFFGGTNYFANFYQGIRRATIFVNNIDKVPLAGTISGGRPLRSAWKAEARFIRALLYFELVKRYGGVPLLGNQVRQITDDILLPRNSFADCVEYIVSECDAIKDSLRDDRPFDAINYGRVTHSAPLALKARVLLYAASPLYNGGNTGTTPAQRLVAGYETYDANRWKRAADAALEIINSGTYALTADFRNVFTEANNTESIFFRNSSPNKDIETNNGPLGFSGNALGNGRTSPSQNLVNSFPTLNGRPITDPLSQYNPDSPYVRRDKRLDFTVIHNDSQWLGTTIQTYEGGRSKPGGTRVQTKTSYYLRKFMGKFETATEYSNTRHNFILFRYAEVLLNYAEAMNEFSGPSDDIYNQLVLLRERAGINAGSGATKYGISLSITKEDLRKVIQNERRIELAFEEHRFWDIRRWKIAEELNNTPVKGLTILFPPATNKLQFINKDIYNMVFDKSKMYLYPIMQTEIDKNRNLIQNPGW